MAEQLIAGVLDIQLQQLRENGLQHLPVFIDIVAMRANLNRLTAEQMQAVRKSLAEAQSSSEPRRTELIQEARRQARDVVVVLLAERDRLRRRMRVARLAAELQQLIVMQLETFEKTGELRNESPVEQERELLSVIEDQRDNHVVFGQLATSLDAVSGWGGNTGTSAMSCLQVLTQREVDKQYSATEQLMAAAQLAGAAESQEQIIVDLRAALQRLRDSLGVDDLNPSTKALQARELLDQQRQLREETAKADLAEEKVADELSQRQREIHQQIGALKESLADLPRQRQLADAAEKAAYEAEGNLFQSERDAALDSQRQAIERLEDLAESLEGTDQLDGLDATEDGSGSERDQLQQLDQELQALDEQQSQVVDNAESRPTEAGRMEKQIADSLDKASQRQPLSEAVKQSVRNAAEAAQQATETMKDVAADASQDRLEAASEVKEALQQARDATQARMEQLEQSSSPESTDLVQAAEDLERAARAEQELAEMAGKSELTSSNLDDQVEAQSQATATVGDVAKQVQESASAVSQQLGQVESNMREIGKTLESMQRDDTMPETSVVEVARGANQTAASLLQMASQLRQQMANSDSQGEATASTNADPTQTAQNQSSQNSTADSQSQNQGESQPSETNNVAPSESGNRLTSDQGRARDGTSADERRSLKDSPWFAKLPPALRESIRARTRRRPPRGYEERLRRYFESVD